MSKILLILLILVLLGGGGYYLYSKRTSLYPTTTNYVTTPTYTNPGATAGEKVTVTLNAQNDSGEKGIVTLEEVDGKVDISLFLTGAPEGVTQPAHIHTGSCATIGGVLYPLTFPVNGSSRTILDVSMADLKAQIPLALNVHKSQTEASVYYSCGDLPL